MFCRISAGNRGDQGEHVALGTVSVTRLARAPRPRVAHPTGATAAAAATAADDENHIRAHSASSGCPDRPRSAARPRRAGRWAGLPGLGKGEREPSFLVGPPGPHLEPGTGKLGANPFLA